MGRGGTTQALALEAFERDRAALAEAAAQEWSYDIRRRAVWQ